MTIFWLGCLGQTPGTSDNPGSAGVYNDTTIAPLETQKKVWQWGVTGGLLFSTIEGDLNQDNSYTPDFHAGIYGITEIFSPLGIRLELYYAGLGTGYVSVSDSKLHLNYLITPILITYEIRSGISLGLGPYFGYLLSARQEGDDYVDNITDLISSLDVGGKIGVYFQMGRSVNLSVAFQRGFINTQDGERVSNLKQYNQCVMFTTSVNISSILNR